MTLMKHVYLVLMSTIASVIMFSLQGMQETQQPKNFDAQKSQRVRELLNSTWNNGILRFNEGRPKLLDIIELIKQGANPNETDKNGYTALHRAASIGSVDLCQKLLDVGADIAICGIKIKEKKKYKIRILIDRQYHDIICGDSPFFQATVSKEMDCAWFLRRKMDEERNKITGDDKYPDKQGVTRIIQLIKAGANPNFFIGDGDSIFVRASARAHISPHLNDAALLDCLLEYGFDIAHQDKHCSGTRTAEFLNKYLALVVYPSGNHPTNALLLKHGIDVRNFKGVRAHLSLYQCYPKLMIGGIAAVVVASCYGIYKWFMSKKQDQKQADKAVVANQQKAEHVRTAVGNA